MIFILNGPPSSGKDSLADHMIKLYPDCFIKEKFAHAMKRANKELFGISEEVFQLYDNDPKLKNTKSELFCGFSWRETNILISEKFVKPTFGKDFFGKSLINRIDPHIWDRDIIVSDGGFPEEIVPLIEKYGEDEIVIIRLYRDGFTFADDSRKYIEHDHNLGIRIFDLVSGEYGSYLEEGLELINDLTSMNIFNK